MKNSDIKATIAGMCPREQVSFPKGYIRAMIVESDRTDAVKWCEVRKGKDTTPRQVFMAGPDDE